MNYSRQDAINKARAELFSKRNSVETSDVSAKKYSRFTGGVHPRPTEETLGDYPPRPTVSGKIHEPTPMPYRPDARPAPIVFPKMYGAFTEALEHTTHGGPAGETPHEIRTNPQEKLKPGYYYIETDTGNSLTYKPYKVTETFNPMQPVSDTNVAPEIPPMPNQGMALHPYLDPANWNKPAAELDAMHSDFISKTPEIMTANPTYGGLYESYEMIKRTQRTSNNKRYKTKNQKNVRNTRKQYKVSNFEKMSGLYLDEDMKTKEVSLKRKQRNNRGMKKYSTKKFRDLVF